MTDAAFDQELVAALPRLRRFAYGLAGSLDEADDLVQAACERALAHREQYEPGTRLVSWMYRIVQTIWIEPDSAAPARVSGSGHARGISRRRCNGRGEVPAGACEVRRAIAVLSPEQRTVLLLVSVEGLAYREAAEILGLPMGTIMSRLARARLALAKALEEPEAARTQAVMAQAARAPTTRGPTTRAPK